MDKTSGKYLKTTYVEYLYFSLIINFREGGVDQPCYKIIDWQGVRVGQDICFLKALWSGEARLFKLLLPKAYAKSDM